MKNFYYEGTRFKNGNCNIRFSPDDIADIKSGKLSDIEILFFKMEKLDLYFFGEQFCISNFTMGILIYSAYSGKLFLLDYSDIDKYLLTGKTLKLKAFRPDADQQKIIDEGNF
jgi:hypothetical protein